MEIYESVLSVPQSESDKLLSGWGYSLQKDYYDLVEFASMQKGKTVVDLATGSGRICSILTRFGYQVITGDNTLKDIEKAKRRITDSYLQKVRFLCLNMEKLPFTDNTIDNLICLNTLHELDNPQICLEEMIRVHSGHGKIIISDFNSKGFELMQKIHEIVYRNDHRTGSISMEEVRKAVDSRYQNVSIFNTSLNHAFIAEAKKI